jgi:hypothetical protein
MRLKKLAPFLLFAFSCNHDPIPCENPLPQGALLLSEVAKDTKTGQWVELYNPETQEKKLLGVTLVFTKRDGSASKKVIVRDKELKISPKGYVVLGLCTKPLCPKFVDCPFQDQFEAQSLYSSMVVELYSCGTLLDSVDVNVDLPQTGSYSKDFHKNKWCKSAQATPKEENKPCD